MALAMGVLSVRYSYKSLLLAGLLVNLVSALCCNFAPTFRLLLVCFSAMGLVYGEMHVAAVLIYLVGVRDREEP